MLLRALRADAAVGLDVLLEIFGAVIVIELLPCLYCALDLIPPSPRIERGKRGVDAVEL